jgi:hypothetical protein
VDLSKTNYSQKDLLKVSSDGITEMEIYGKKALAKTENGIVRSKCSIQPGH